MQLLHLQIIFALLAIALFVNLGLLAKAIRAGGALRRRKKTQKSGAKPAEAVAPASRRSGPSVTSTGRQSRPCLPSGFYDQVERGLEQAFDRYSLKLISLETYVALVLAEEQSARSRIGQLSVMRREGQIGDAAYAEELGLAKNALAAVRWCLDWAEDLARTSLQGAPRVDAVAA